MGNSGNSEIGGLVNSGNWEIREIGEFRKLGIREIAGGFQRKREEDNKRKRKEDRIQKKKDDKGKGGGP